jgi:outer membrane protein assembly factor BamB
VIKRISGVALLALCIAWTVFAFKSLVADSAEASLLNYFSLDDQAIIAIHHPNDVNLNDLTVDANQNNLQLFKSIQHKLQGLKTAYLSKSRNLLVLSSKDLWTFAKVRALFEEGIFTFKKIGQRQFQFGPYLGEFKGHELLLRQEDILLNLDHHSFLELDPQASYSIVHLDSNDNYVEDIYIKSNCRIIYGTKAAPLKGNMLVDDMALFGACLPENLTKYLFYEKNYLNLTDSSFKKSPIFSAVKTGAAITYMNETPILMFDIAPGVALTSILNEKLKLPEDNKDRATYSSFPTCAAFPSSEGTSLTVFSQDGIGYITSDERALDGLLLEIDMRKTTSAKGGSVQNQNESLPKLCSYRKIEPNTLECVSWIHHKLRSTTITQANQSSVVATEDTKNYFTMNPGAAISSFCALTGRGNLILATDNQLIGYKNGSQKWSQPHPNSLKGKPLRLGTSLEENDYALLEYEDQISVIDVMGRSIFQIKGRNYAPPIQLKIKDKPAFALAKLGEIVCYSSDNGKMIKKYPFSEGILSWKGMAFGGKSGFGIRTKDALYFIDLANGKKKRIDGNVGDFVSVTSIGFVGKGEKGMELSTGTKIEIQVPAYWNYAGELTFGKETGLLFFHESTLVLAVNGKVRWKKSLNLSEISEVVAGKNAIFVRDALQNKMFMLNTTGDFMDQEERPSQMEIQVTPFGTFGSSVTTYLSGFLIQYNF